MPNYDITSQLQDFLTNNTPGGYFQTETNIPVDDLANRIEQIISTSDLGYIKKNESINFIQIENAIRDNIKPVAFSGSFKNLNDLPGFPEEYEGWLTPNSVNETKPVFHKVAFSGDYNDLKNKIDPTNLTIPWEKVTNKQLANIATSGKFSDLIYDSNDDYSQIFSKVNLQNLNGYRELVQEASNIAAINAAETIYFHQISESTDFCNLVEGIYDTTSLDNIGENHTIRELLNELLNEFQVNGIFKETVIKLITAQGTCTLLSIESKNNIYKFNFSYIDAAMKNNLDWLTNEDNINITDEIKSYNLNTNLFYPTFYYDAGKEKLIIKRNYIAVNKTFDLSETSLNELTNNTDIINTTENLIDDLTINNWLNILISLYNINTIIKIKNNQINIKLENITNQDNIYVFTFSPYTEVNLNNENDLELHTYLFYFIYDKTNNTLRIKQNEISI